MGKSISILLLEDNAIDAELIRQTLISEGLQPMVRHVTSRSAFEDALRLAAPDLIISDFSIPGYNGKVALTAARRACPDTPFIFYSGTIGEEAAIEALKLGATDYVLKDKPKRLISAIQRAVDEAEQRQKQREADKKIVALAQLLDLATDAILVRDLEDRIQFWSQGAERLYGFTQAEIIGKKSTEFLTPADQSIFFQAKRGTLEQGQWQGEMEHFSKDRKSIIVVSRWTLVRNSAGGPDRILAINTDVTERKSLEKQFLRAQRLESIGTLASGIAHDLNNILAPILMACEVLKDAQSTEEAKGMMGVALKSAQRGADVVKQLLTFVRGSDGKRVLLQTSALLEDICNVLRKMLPKNIQMSCEIGEQLPPINADATQMHQVLMNLCVNARDAMPSGGTLKISATSGPEYSVLIRVEDTGIGIPPDLLDKIFDPFFTTKEVGKGTGLGLSTVAGILKSHGGKLRLESTVGMGTTFEISLPGVGGVGTSPP